MSGCSKCKEATTHADPLRAVTEKKKPMIQFFSVPKSLQILFSTEKMHVLHVQGMVISVSIQHLVMLKLQKQLNKTITLLKVISFR